MKTDTRHKEIVDQILDELRPHKRGADAARNDILANIKFPMVAWAQEWDALIRSKKKAERAAKALAALEKDLPNFCGFDFGIIRTVLEGIAYGKGPDPRFSYLNWICAHQAYVLVKSHSRKRPATSENGNLHVVAQLLFEAFTGKPSSETGLLRAVKKVKNWRQEHFPT